MQESFFESHPSRASNTDIGKRYAWYGFGVAPRSGAPNLVKLYPQPLELSWKRKGMIRTRDPGCGHRELLPQPLRPTTPVEAIGLHPVFSGLFPVKIPFSLRFQNFIENVTILAPELQFGQHFSVSVLVKSLQLSTKDPQFAVKSVRKTLLSQQEQFLYHDCWSPSDRTDLFKKKKRKKKKEKKKPPSQMPSPPEPPMKWHFRIPVRPHWAPPPPPHPHFENFWPVA